MVAEPSEQSRISLKRIHTKARVIELLVDGEMPLLEAAAWFRYVNDNPPDFPSEFRSLHHGQTDGEKACRQVIQWLQYYLPSRMPRSQATLIACQYQAELDRILDEKEGMVALPW
jgi:hypothetical protein